MQLLKSFCKHYKRNETTQYVRGYILLSSITFSCHDMIVFAGLYVFYKKGNSQVSNIKMEIHDFRSWCNAADTATFLFCCGLHYAVTLNCSIRRPDPLWGRRPLKSHSVWNLVFRTLLFWESVFSPSKVKHIRQVPNLFFFLHIAQQNVKTYCRSYFVIYNEKYIFKPFQDSSTAIGIWLHSSFLLTTPTTQMWSYHMSWLAACQSWR